MKDNNDKSLYECCYNCKHRYRIFDKDYCLEDTDDILELHSIKEWFDICVFYESK